MKKWIAHAAVAAVLATAAAPALAVEQRENNEFRMVGDLLVARPVGAVLTVLGAAAFVVSLPFTAATRSIDEAAKVLVVGPVRETFVRCLGCIQSGPLENEGSN